MKDQNAKTRPPFCLGGAKIGRRRFIAGSCALAGLGALKPGGCGFSSDPNQVRLRVVYALSDLTIKKPDWPYQGFDFRPVIEHYDNLLEQAFPDHRFDSLIARDAEAAQRILKKDQGRDFDGYIVFQMNVWNVAAQPLATAGKPLLYVNYSFGGDGGFLVYNSSFLRAGAPHVGFVCSSNSDDLIAAVACFEMVKQNSAPAAFAQVVARSRLDRTPAPGDLSGLADPLPAVKIAEIPQRLQEFKVLAVGGKPANYLGVRILPVSFEELNRTADQADREQVAAQASRWRGSARAVHDVSDRTLEDSAAMYLAMKELLGRYEAQAITIDCLQGFYSGKIHAYPCLGHHELNNQGLVGACEGDISSTVSMILAQLLSGGRPGYISDPSIDTGRRRITYAHCVASNRPFGPEGPANPFEILTHSEDRKGASIRSILPPGYITTSIQFGPTANQILFHQAKAVDNDPDDRGCRTKLVAEPIGDFEKLFTQWDRWGWHRVTIYGDLRERVFDLAHLLGYQVVEEA